MLYAMVNMKTQECRSTERPLLKQAEKTEHNMVQSSTQQEYLVNKHFTKKNNLHKVFNRTTLRSVTVVPKMYPRSSPHTTKRFPRKKMIP